MTGKRKLENKSKADQSKRAETNGTHAWENLLFRFCEIRDVKCVWDQTVATTSIHRILRYVYIHTHTYIYVYRYIIYNAHAHTHTHNNAKPRTKHCQQYKQTTKGNRSEQTWQWTSSQWLYSETRFEGCLFLEGHVYYNTIADVYVKALGFRKWAAAGARMEKVEDDGKAPWLP